MKNYRGLIVFFSSLILYLFCLDRGASLWDCPEYILVAWRLEVGHPPGNPTWQLIANVISHLGGSERHAAVIINSVSAVSMALAATFLSSVIYILLRGSLLKGGGRNEIIASLCAVCGALCYAWCDSAIFSAVEAEVYALSAMFTTLMLLLSLKWAQARARRRIALSRRLLILTAYIAGLGVGVHELNFLVLPAMALVYLYGCRAFPVKPGRRFHFRAPRLDGIPTLLWSMALFWIGTSTYLLIPIRAAANPPVNQGNPSSWEGLKSYYARHQYGSTPLLYGPTPYSRPLLLERMDDEGNYSYTHYYLKEGKGRLRQYAYPDELNMWFPRMTGHSDEDIRFYEAWAGMYPEDMVEVMASAVADSAGNQMGKVNPLSGQREKQKTLRPTYFQQFRYMASYQLGYMYFRYLLWNFVGRQNNIHSTGGKDTGNFITGIGPVDDAMLGPQGALPPSYRENNKGYNRYFMIPFIMGLIGIVALLRGGKRGRRVCAVVALFFLFTGVLIAVYLNQSPGEPRERDYSFLGSYMAYSIWIACGMAAISRFLFSLKTRHLILNRIARGAALLICIGIPLQMLSQTYDDHDRSRSRGAEDVAQSLLEGADPEAIILANGDNAIFPLWYAQEVLGMRRDVTVVAVPYLVTEWYRNQLKIPGEESKALLISDSIPAGPGKLTDRVIRNIIELNGDSRPIYRANPREGLQPAE